MKNQEISNQVNDLATLTLEQLERQKAIVARNAGFGNAEDREKIRRYLEEVDEEIQRRG